MSGKETEVAAPAVRGGSERRRKGPGPITKVGLQIGLPGGLGQGVDQDVSKGGTKVTVPEIKVKTEVLERMSKVVKTLREVLAEASPAVYQVEVVVQMMKT